MSPKNFKEIREKLGLTQKELSDVFGFSGKGPISHFEIGFRQPSELVLALMRIFESLPEKKALALVELLRIHMEKKSPAKKKSTSVRKS